MEAAVMGELGVERRCHEGALTGRDDRAIAQLRQDLDAGSDRLDQRGADEDGVERICAEDRHIEIRFERVALPAERIPANADVHQAGERMRMTGHIAGDEDRAGTGTPHGHAGSDPRPKLWDEAVLLGELADRRALATWDHERVDVIELLGTAHIDGRGAESFEGVEMLAEVALKAEDAGAS